MKVQVTDDAARLLMARLEEEPAHTELGLLRDRIRDAMAVPARNMSADELESVIKAVEVRIADLQSYGNGERPQSMNAAIGRLSDSLPKLRALLIRTKAREHQMEDSDGNK